jgi:hypothetical protein
MEKLTVEEVIQELIRDGWMGKDNFINILKQIRDEVQGNLWKNNSSTEENINEVFNKYLNEK